MDTSNGGVEYSLVDWAKPYLDDKRKLLNNGHQTRRAVSTKGAYAAATLALQCLNPRLLRPKMSVVLSTLEQLEAAAKPRTKHTESPRARYSSAIMQKSRLDIVKIGLC
ncbi:hypothetical protein Bca52824_062805 [Brassica carinata]|uniref:Uncharacterized protein n=1 Tax=Brassica carinata TaxID=52824 RepID=A0A8X7QDJ1_BRACI|nr:hypothetical protein Bca52824_062805 [Brassica carinata]